MGRMGAAPATTLEGGAQHKTGTFPSRTDKIGTPIATAARKTDSVVNCPPSIRSAADMPPFTFIPAILQRQHAAETIYPRAMQCYAIPYGWPGFAGDMAALYIGMRIHHGQPPLLFFHHREIRYPRLRKWLATAQLVLCTALGIWNSIRCSSFNPSRTG
jgi:hypothetical protein